MRIVVLNGSPHQKGNTKKMIDAFAEGAESTGHQVDVLDVCQKQIGGCMACEYCHIKGKGVCIQKDDMQEVYGLLKQADMLVLALLFIVHHVLNFGWAKNLFKGKYTSSRIFCTVLLGLLFVDIIVLVVSGIMMSGYVFPMISIHSGIASARRLHMITAYWGLILLSAHLGYNW